MEEQDQLADVNGFRHEADKIITEVELGTFSTQKTIARKISEQTFLTWIATMVLKHNQLVNIGIRGNVRTKKSTVGCTLLDILNALREKQLGIPIGTRNRFALIAMSFGEYLRITRPEKGYIHHCSVLIDELDRGEQLGAGTMEESISFDQDAEMFASDYIDKISISPNVVYDNMTEIILETVGPVNTETEYKVRCKVFYREITTKQTYPLGHVDITVTKVLTKNFYKKYYNKKVGRKNLTKEHNIRNLRDMEYSKPALMVYEELRDSAASGLRKELAIGTETIVSSAQMYIRKCKLPWTTVAESLVATKAKNVLTLTWLLHQTKQEYHKLIKKKEYNKAQSAEKVFNTHKKNLATHLTELHHLTNICDEYMNIGGELGKWEHQENTKSQENAADAKKNSQQQK